MVVNMIRLIRRICIKCDSAFHTGDTYPVCGNCAPSPVDAVIAMMTSPAKRIYARFWWEWICNRYPRLPNVPSRLSEKEASDIRFELVMYSTRTGRKLDLTGTANELDKLRYIPASDQDDVDMWNVY